MNEGEIYEAYRELDVKAQLLYNFVIQYYNYIYTNHGYGAAESFNMMEIHTVTYIEDNPGVTVTELAGIWNKTKSAVSTTVKRLIAGGYVEKRYREDNDKSFYLYVTENGRRLSLMHKAYDVTDIRETMRYLTDRCGEADVAAFYRVLEEYTKLFR